MAWLGSLALVSSDVHLSVTRDYVSVHAGGKICWVQICFVHLPWLVYHLGTECPCCNELRRPQILAWVSLLPKHHINPLKLAPQAVQTFCNGSWGWITNCTPTHVHRAINLSLPIQKGSHFEEDDIFRCIYVNEKFGILIKISLKFVPKGQIDNNPALV